jgi:diphthamide synthase (EF-2-diphthine--ammonia ligase)
MHAVRRTLVEAQADRLGLEITMIEIPYQCSNGLYESKMATAMTSAIEEDVVHVVFGDLFLEDVRSYREQRLADLPVSPLFPLWGKPTDRLAADFVKAGGRAIVTCVDPRKVPASLVGRHFDEEFVADLPDGVDPCGEFGEFHTFVYDGPGFSSPIEVRTGEVVKRDGFVFCDVLPV